MDTDKKLKKEFLTHLHPHHIEYGNRDFGLGVSYIYDYAMKGKSWFCAGEALIDAHENGNNQVFFAPTKNQVFIFVYYMNWLLRHAGMKELPINKQVIELENGAKLYFFSTHYNSKRLAGIHGNVYMDSYEFFPKSYACDFYLMGKAISAHKKHRLTLIDRIINNSETAPELGGCPS